MEFLEQNGSTLYIASFFGSIALVSVWESLAARRQLVAPLRTRWIGNFSIYFIGTALTRLLFPGLVVAASLWATANNWGLFNQISAPPWLVLPIVLVALDFSRYVQHWVLHNVPVLWRVHGMHHTDLDYDFTTSFRFHPLEAIFFFATIIGSVTLLGAPVAAVLLAEIIFAFSAILVHGNIRIPLKVDTILRQVLVTPDVHRIHHSIDPQESNSNFGNLFCLWDRLLGTWIDQPAAGHEGMTIGLEGYEDIEHVKLGRMLIHPFLAPVSTDRQAADGFAKNSANPPL